MIAFEGGACWKGISPARILKWIAISEHTVKQDGRLILHIFVTECHEFACDITKCIPLNEVCDGIAQCEDKTDEQQNCPTGKLTLFNNTNSF